MAWSVVSDIGKRSSKKGSKVSFKLSNCGQLLKQKGCKTVLEDELTTYS